MRKRKQETIETELVLPKQFMHLMPKTISYCVKPPTDAEGQAKLADELVEWSRLPEALSIHYFPISRSMSPRKFYQLAETNEYFEDCLDIARTTIGERLLQGYRDGILEKNYVMRFYALYDKDFKDMVLAKHRITEEARHAGNTINAIFPPITEEEPQERE